MLRVLGQTQESGRRQGQQEKVRTVPSCESGSLPYSS